MATIAQPDLAPMEPRKSKIYVPVDADLRRAVRMQAANEGCSVPKVILKALRKYLAA